VEEPGKTSERVGKALKTRKFRGVLKTKFLKGEGAQPPAGEAKGMKIKLTKEEHEI